MMHECQSVVVRHWRDYRDLGPFQLHGKSMFFYDRLVAPTLRAVKFRDDIIRVLDANLIDSILVAV